MHKDTINHLLEDVMIAFAEQNYDSMFIAHEKGVPIGSQVCFLLYSPQEKKSKLDTLFVLKRMLNELKHQLEDQGFILKYTLQVDDKETSGAEAKAIDTADEA